MIKIKWVEFGWVGLGWAGLGTWKLYVEKGVEEKRSWRINLVCRMIWGGFSKYG